MIRLGVAAATLLAAAMFAPLASAQMSKKQIDDSVRRGVDYLIKQGEGGSHATPSLAVYALIKAGQSPDQEMIARVLEGIVRKVDNGVYKPASQQYYEAGVDIMALEAAMHQSGDDKRYLKEIEAIVKYILDGQKPSGGWFYPGPNDTGGDTSITQYALLGLWAAHRAGIKVPASTWDRAAAWHIRTQQTNGDFIYHPGGGGGVISRHSMTVNGIASLCIIRLHLFPKGDYKLPSPAEIEVPSDATTKDAAPNQAAGSKGKEGGLQKEPPNKPSGPADSGDDSQAAGGAATAAAAAGTNADKKTKPKKRFGILVPVEVGTGTRVEEQVVKGQPGKPAAIARPQVPLADINNAIARSVGWLTKGFAISGIDGWVMYYLYGLERASALADIEKYGNHDWYQEGAAFLIGVQQKDGAFPGHLNNIEGTSFALLFLTNATRSLFTPDGKPRIAIGGGLLIGNRGLPENLSEINMTAQGAQARKITGPVDELLAELENPKSLQIEAAQTAIVEKVQLGDREALIGQRERLLRLVEDPRVEVRRTMLWALGRCSLLVDVPIFLHALEDPDVSVVVEANNALCWLSRRPAGVGLPSDPLAGLPEDAPEEQKLAAINKWREGLRQGWRKWFSTVQPYKDREFAPAPRAQ